MKLFARISAALLTVVYLLAEVGFDVHCDHQSGRNYLVFLASGISSCEEIHPDHPCCHHNHCGCSSDESCCSDFYEYLQISEDVPVIQDIVPACPCLPVSVQFVQENCSFGTARPAVDALQKENPPPRAGLLRLCILRV